MQEHSLASHYDFLFHLKKVIPTYFGRYCFTILTFLRYFISLNRSSFLTALLYIGHRYHVKRNASHMGIRQCSKCKDQMTQSQNKPIRIPPHIWGEVMQKYDCTHCGHKTTITLPSSILFNLVTGISGIAVFIYGCLNLKTFYLLLSSDIIGALAAVFLGILFIFYVIGSGFAIRTAVKAFIHNRQYPDLSPRSAVIHFLLTMCVSSLPVLLSVGFGFYDHFVKDIKEGLAIFLIPIIFSPLFFGTKLGLNFMGLFLGCCFWMALLVASIVTFG